MQVQKTLSDQDLINFVFKTSTANSFDPDMLYYLNFPDEPPNYFSAYSSWLKHQTDWLVKNHDIRFALQNIIAQKVDFDSDYYCDNRPEIFATLVLNTGQKYPEFINDYQIEELLETKKFNFLHLTILDAINPEKLTEVLFKLVESKLTIKELYDAFLFDSLYTKVNLTRFFNLIKTTYQAPLHPDIEKEIQTLRVTFGLPFL